MIISLVFGVSGTRLKDGKRAVFTRVKGLRIHKGPLYYQSIECAQSSIFSVASAAQWFCPNVKMLENALEN